MIRNKYIILPFLFIAWAIIFVHSIFPHHHHIVESRNLQNHCRHESHQHINHDVLGAPQFNCCDHNETEHACHFNVEILTQVSLDNIFITYTGNALFSDISGLKRKLVSYYQEFIPKQILQKYYLRGPPQFHNS